MAQSWWQWLRGWWNIGSIGGLFRLLDTISKVRARHDTRNEQGYSQTLGYRSLERPTQPAAVNCFADSDYPKNVLPHSRVQYAVRQSVQRTLVTLRLRSEAQHEV